MTLCIPSYKGGCTLEHIKKTPETCHTCKQTAGTWRTPYLADRVEAERMGYFSCDPCFTAVWAGEN